MSQEKKRAKKQKQRCQTPRNRGSQRPQRSGRRDDMRGTKGSQTHGILHVSIICSVNLVRLLSKTGPIVGAGMPYNITLTESAAEKS